MVAVHRPVLCVVAGPNGSGKTSTTEKLLANEWAVDSVYINPDNIALEQFGDWNSQDAVLKAAKEATRLRYQCLEEQKSFVFETVFSSEEKLEFLLKAHSSGFFIRFFYVCTENPEPSKSVFNCALSPVSELASSCVESCSSAFAEAGLPSEAKIPAVKRHVAKQKYAIFLFICGNSFLYL